MNKLDRNIDLESQLQALDKDIAPSRDLWSGVSLAIEQKSFNESEVGQKNYRVPLAWAASIVFAVLVTWNWTGPGDDEVMPVTLVAMQQEFTQNKELLLVSLGQPDLESLPQDMKVQFAQIESAKNSLKESLKEDPDNVDLMNLLKWLNQQELDLLEQLFQPQWQTI